jgi:hypothetical protein
MEGKPVTQQILSLVITVLTAVLSGDHGTASAIPPANESSQCDTTKPNGNVPPGERPSPNHHGGAGIWTVLWPDGRVVFKPGGPGFVLEDGSLAMKFPWWRGVKGKLIIEGRRLDSSAPPLRASIPDGYGDTGFQATSLIFPTPGCWEVTGRVGNASLTFVVHVVKLESRK